MFTLPSAALVVFTVLVGVASCVLLITSTDKARFSGLRLVKQRTSQWIRALYGAPTISVPPIRRTRNSTNAGAFQRLPAEIRLLIYKHAIGNRVIHLVQGDRLRRRICYLDDNVDGWYHNCWAFSSSQAKISMIVRRPRPVEVLNPDQLNPLLLTCRHIYSEAIDLLYSSNTFHFLRPSDFLYFVNRIGPTKSEQIRSIKLYVNPCPCDAILSYTAFWSSIRTLPLLRQLRLLIAPSVMTKEDWKTHEPELLEPIKNFSKHLDVFDVFLAVFPDWTEQKYLEACHLRSIKEMEQLSGAHLSRYS